MSSRFNMLFVTAVCRTQALRLTFRQVAALQYLPIANTGARQNQSRASWASSVIVRQVMQSNRSRDTRPELILRSCLHRRGLRFWVARRPIATLPRTADLVFPGARVAVFFNGCFWHACPRHSQIPNLNAGYWRPKIAATAARDAITDRELSQAGWKVIRVWEHETVGSAVERIARVVRSRLQAPARILIE
jgi:DNA mismatch endonuclease (patch repair protein)